MQVVLATEPGTPGWPNEDFAAVAPGAAVLLDGCTTWPPGTVTGCVHGVAWYARMLGGAFLSRIIADPPAPLAESLSGAIIEVRNQHEDICDLTNPATPAATVTAVRVTAAGIDLLALADSVIMADYGDDRPPLVITDTHKAASASADAAGRAYTTILPSTGLRSIALLSDGATRITDQYDLLSWSAMLAVIRDDGPAQLIRQVRAAEDSDPGCTRWPRSKARDDATIIYWPGPVEGPM
jgi:Protein phosphatase 2C